MKASSTKFIITGRNIGIAFVALLVMYFELAVIELGGDVFFGRSHGMMADATYRRTERIAAFMNYHLHASPENKAIFQEEMRLMHKHEDWKWEVFLCLFVLINVFGFYYYFRDRSKTHGA